MKSTSVLEELTYVLGLFQQPLLALFQSTSLLIDQSLSANNNNATVNAKVLFQSIKHMLKIFYCLNSVDLPEYFEDHMKEWMELFKKYLTLNTQNPELIGDEDDDKPSILHRVQGLICQNINLYVEKYEEEFNPYLQVFLTDVWTLLMKNLLSPRYDSLVSSAIKFLTSVTTSIHYGLFKDPQTLKGICENIVIPNMELRTNDLELFEDNPIEYIRRDIEGSDSDTRRKSATELVKGLRKNYEQEVTGICSSYITAMIQQYLTNPQANWKAKDIAIYLITALAVKSSTSLHGTTDVNSMVPLLDFFTSQIWPELQSTNPPALILKADSLKFITTFRLQLPKSVLVSAFPVLLSHLENPNYVVLTYAANCIEKILTSKEKIEGNYINRFTKEDLRPFLQTSLVNLFKALTSAQENDYVMKAIMRVVSISQEDMMPFSSECIKQLLAVLDSVAKNPTNPSFNHYLFETIAAVITNIGTKNPQTIQSFESQLFGPFTFILQTDIQEFAPYVFQVLSLLLEVTPTTVSNAYMQIFPALLTPLLWERPGNVPALVRLIQAFLQKGAQLVFSGNYLAAILGVFQKLVASKAHDHEGFYILESIVDNLKPEQFSQFMPQIFTLVFTRLQKDKTLKFIKSFLVFLSLFVGKHGAAFVITQVDAVQKDLFANILSSLYLPNIQKVNGKIERKMAVIAISKLLSDPACLNAPYFPDIWSKFIPTALSLLEGQEDDSVPADLDDSEIEEFQGYTTAFSQLVHAMKQDQDPFKDATFANPKHYFALSIHNLCKTYPGKFPALIEQSATAEGMRVLQSYFQSMEMPQPWLM